MADTKITDLAALTSLASNDWLLTVDVSDTSMAASGTDKKITVANLFTSPTLFNPIIGDGTTLSTLSINGAAGQVRDLNFRANGVDRWKIRCSNETESTGNLGSNFEIRRRADDGSDIGSALSINRSTGLVSIAADLTVNGLFTGKSGRSATVVVAASNAATWTKLNADYVCDGTDDQSEINTAIASLPLSGGKVLLTEGSFSISSAVIIDRDNVALEGMGSGLPAGSSFSSGGDSGDPIVIGGPTRLNVTAGFTGSYVIDVKYSTTARSVYNIELRDFGINGISGPASVTGIRWSVIRGSMRYIFVQYMTGHGIYANNEGDSNIGNDAPFNTYVDHVRIVSCTQDGFRFGDGATDFFFTACDIHQNGGDGISAANEVSYGSTAHMIHGCYLWSNGGKAISCRGWNMRIIGNRIQDCNGGVYISGSSSSVSAFLIEGNHFRNCSKAGDGTYDAINITSSVVANGGTITGNHFQADSGLDNGGTAPNKYRARYGINIASANINDVVIGPNGFGYRSSDCSSTFQTGYINDLGTNTLIQDPQSMQLKDGANIQVGSTTGTKFGTSTTQKIGFYNATPIVQPSSATDLGTVLSDLGLRSSGSSYALTFSGGLNLFKSGGTNSISMSAYGSTAYNHIYSVMARGTVSVPLRTKLDDVLLRIVGTGAYAVDDATTATIDTNAHASIDIVASQDWTSTAQGSHLVFYGVNFGATTRAEAFRVGRASQGIDFSLSGMATSLIRYKNNVVSTGRNAAGNGDVSLYKINASDQFELMADVLYTDAKNIVFGTTTGTKIGTSTSQKIGFFNATPVVQPSNTTDLRTALINLGLYAAGGATPLNLNGGTLSAGTTTVGATGSSAALTTSGTITNANGVNFSHAVKTTTSTSVSLINSFAWIIPSGGDIAGSHYGLLFGPTIKDDGGVQNNMTGSVIGLLSRVDLADTYTGTVSNAYGLYASAPSKNGGTGVWTNYTGVFVASITGASNFNCGLRVDTATQQTIWVGGNTTGTTAAQGIAFGSGRDFGIYRSGSAAGTITGGLTTTGSLSVGTTNDSAFSVNRTVTDPTTAAIYLAPTLYTGSTGKAIITSQATLSPTASFANAYGMLFIPTLGDTNANAFNITTVYGLFARVDSNNNYTGTVTNVRSFFAGNPSRGTGAVPYTNLIGFFCDTFTNGNGITSGSVVNTGFLFAGTTAAAGSGGTVINSGVYLTLPSGSSAGTSNYGVYITGNGGGSATANYAIYSDSTAPSLLAGGLGFKGATSGTTTLVATAVAGTTTLTLPAVTDTLVGKTTTDTLTNKTLTSANANLVTPAGTTATGKSFNIATPTNGGTITNTYGLYINSQANGTQTNIPYGIYQAGAADRNYFAGRSCFGLEPSYTGYPEGIIDVRWNPTSHALGEAMVRLTMGPASQDSDNPSNTPGNGYVPLYTEIKADVNRVYIWGMNTLCLTDTTASGNNSEVYAAEFDISNYYGNAPDPETTYQKLGCYVAAGGTFMNSAAFACNALAVGQSWKHGMWFAKVGNGVAGSTLIKAGSGCSVETGIDLSGASMSGGALLLPNNAAIVAKDTGGVTQHVLSLAGDNRVLIGWTAGHTRTTSIDGALLQVGSGAAGTSAIGIPNNTGLSIRNAANSGDIVAISLDTSNVVNLYGTAVKISSTGSVTLASQSAPTAAQGQAFFDSTRKTMGVGAGVSATPVNVYPSNVIFSQTASIASTTTAETKSLIAAASGVGTLTLPANFLAAGKALRLRIFGHITTGATAGTITFLVKMGSTTIASTGAVAPTTGQSNRYWESEIMIMCRTIGASGTMFTQGAVNLMNANTPAAGVTWPIRSNAADPPAAVTVDTTASQAIDFQSTTSNNGHTITVNIATLEVLN